MMCIKKFRRKELKNIYSVEAMLGRSVFIIIIIICHGARL